jgi:hypothetical protein
MSYPERMTDEEFKELLDGKDWEEIKNAPCYIWNRALTNREIHEIYIRTNEAITVSFPPQQQ